MERIGLSIVEAAQILGISRRHLWNLTRQGVVPHVRLGRRMTYTAESLRQWHMDQARKTAHRRSA